MSIVVDCECGKKYKVAEDNAGKKMRCKACSGVIAIPKPDAVPADEWDDFGDGFDDFGSGGGFDDFGDDFGDEQEMPPRKPKSGPKTKGESGKKAKGKSGSRGKGKKSGKSKPEMAPALKYSLAGGIVVVAAGAVIGILIMNGTIGGGDDNKQDDVALKGNESEPGNPGGQPGGGNPGGGNPGNPPGGNPGGGPGQPEPKKPGTGQLKPGGGSKDVPTLTVDDLLKKSPVGSTAMVQKRVRVRGTVSGYLQKYQQVMFDVGGGRLVLFRFPGGPSKPISAADEVVLEGVVSRNDKDVIMIAQASIVSHAPASSIGSIIVSAEKLTGDFQADASAANSRYRNKKVTLTGTIARVSGFTTGEVVIRGVSGTMISCLFPDIERATFLPLYYMQRITLAGHLVHTERENTILTLSKCRVIKAEPYKTPAKLPADYVVITKKHIAGIAAKTLKLRDELRWKDSPYYARRVIVEGIVQSIEIAGPKSSLTSAGQVKLVSAELKATFTCNLYCKDFLRALKKGQRVRMVGRFSTAWTFDGIDLSIANCSPVDPLPGVPSPIAKPGTKPPSKAPAAITAAALLSKHKPGDTSPAKQRIRVSGMVTRFEKGWLILQGDGTRTVACRLKTAPSMPPTPGQPVVVEGVFTANTVQYITLQQSRIVPPNAPGASAP